MKGFTREKTCERFQKRKCVWECLAWRPSSSWSQRWTTIWSLHGEKGNKTKVYGWWLVLDSLMLHTIFPLTISSPITTVLLVLPKLKNVISWPKSLVTLFSTIQCLINAHFVLKLSIDLELTHGKPLNIYNHPQLQEPNKIESTPISCQP